MSELISGLPGMSRDDVPVIGNRAFIAADNPITRKKVFMNFIVPVSTTITDASAAAMLQRPGIAKVFLRSYYAKSF